MSNLVPDYLNIDFDTYKDSLKTQLQNSEIFKDFNFEGANITFLIDILAYLSTIQAFFVNKLAKNSYLDTADIYENVHKLATSMGYNPKGYISSRATCTITINESATASLNEGDTLFVDEWKNINSNETYDGQTISFMSTYKTTTTTPALSAFPFTFDVNVKQGILKEYTYTGKDLIDNKIILPDLLFAYDNDINDFYPTIKVCVGTTINRWERVYNFYDDATSLLYSDNVYMFKYDRYGNYVLEFSSIRNVPSDNDNIYITLLETLGINGSVGSNAIINPDNDFVQIDPLGGSLSISNLNTSYYSVTNQTASLGESNPETIENIKNNTRYFLNSQNRTITKSDYINKLEERSDIGVANAWGEQDIAPSGNINDFNKVYISLIPTNWSTSTISTSTGTSATTAVGLSAEDYDGLIYPVAYLNNWEQELCVYLEPYKMLCTYEEFILPVLIYFRFDIGIRINVGYTYTNVKNDVIDKLIYFFSIEKRSFGDAIKFTDIEEFIMDTEKVSNTNTFDYINGVRNFIIRNIDINCAIFEPNDNDNYPQYETSSSLLWEENIIRNIVLRYDQFPILNIDNCTFTQEY